jgi:hypothetical protein
MVLRPRVILAHDVPRRVGLFARRFGERRRHGLVARSRSGAGLKFVTNAGTMSRSLHPASDQGVDFGPLPAEIDDLLQKGVVAYRRDRAAAAEIFRRALALAPEQLPVYFCLYKIHTYQGELDEALVVTEAVLREAARGDAARARDVLETLATLDPRGVVGWRVVADLAESLR